MLYTKDSEIHERVNSISRMSPALSCEHQKNLYHQMIFEKRHYVPNRYPRAEIFSKLRRTLAHISMNNQNIFFDENNNKPLSNNESYPYPAKMPAFLALLGTFELDRWNQQKSLRKNLLARMVELIKKSEYCSCIPEIYSDSTRDIVPLRFVLLGSASHNIWQKIRQYIDVGWIWYRQPIVGATEGLENVGYVSGSCLVSEEICSTIINLPCNVTEGFEQLLLNCIDNSFNNQKAKFPN